MDREDQGAELMESLKIGQVASLAEVGVETIRFYERRGLIEEPPRRASGYRQYLPEAVTRIRFIRRAKGLGFSLQEIKELLALRVDTDTTCADVKDRATAKILRLQDKLEILERMRLALEALVALCSGSGPLTECPILETIDTEIEKNG